MIQYFKEGSKVYFKEGKYQGMIGEVLGDDCVLLTVKVRLDGGEEVEVTNSNLEKKEDPK
jgi:hypothetical protein